MTKPVITTRAGKGSALTWTEGDTNLTNLRDATISVTDGTTTAALDLNDTLTLTAGSGISVAVNASTKTATITNTQSAGATTLDGLSDVVLGTPATGEVLYFNGTNWVDTAASTLTVSAASVASTVTTTADNTTNAIRYPLFSSSSVAANISPMTDNGFQYNPSTGVLSLSSVSAAISATTLSASSTVSGTGFSTYLASPPAIGGTTAAAVTATGLTAKGTTSTAKLTLDTTAVSSTAWTTAGIGLKIQGATFTDTSSLAGTVAASHVHAIAAPTMASTNAITVTDAATLYIADKPTASTNTTITNGWALLTAGNIKAANMTLTGSLSVATNATLKDIRETNYALTYAATITPDCANGTIQTVTLTGNVTFSAFANPVAGQSLTLIVKQDATGSRTLTSTMKFSGGSKTLSTAANSIDIISVFYDGTNYYASLGKGFA